MGILDEDGLYSVQYDDGDNEDMDAVEVFEVLVDEEAEGSCSETGSQQGTTMEDDE